MIFVALSFIVEVIIPFVTNKAKKMGETALPDLSYAPYYYDAPATTPTTPAPCDAPATTPTPYDAPATTTTPAPLDAPATTPATTTPSSAHTAHNVPTALQVVAEGRQA